MFSNTVQYFADVPHLSCCEKSLLFLNPFRTMNWDSRKGTLKPLGELVTFMCPERKALRNSTSMMMSFLSPSSAVPQTLLFTLTNALPLWWLQQHNPQISTACGHGYLLFEGHRMSKHPVSNGSGCSRSQPGCARAD